MARIESNIKRVRQSVRDTQGRYILRTRDLARKMARSGRDNVRALVAPRPIGVFPGYAMTGALQRKVVASEPQRTARGWVAIVRVLLTGKQKRYALIHETGGKIKVKSAAQIRAMFASLRKYGQLRARASRGGRLEYITIRAKHYFRDGIAHTRKTWNLARLRREF